MQETLLLLNGLAVYSKSMKVALECPSLGHKSCQNQNLVTALHGCQGGGSLMLHIHFFWLAQRIGIAVSEEGSEISGHPFLPLFFPVTLPLAHHAYLTKPG